MGGGGTFRYRYRFDGNTEVRDRPGWFILTEESDYWTSPKQILRMVRAALPPPDWADDLLRTARAVFLADKRSSRANARDRWTREIWLELPMLGRDRWTNDCSGHLARLLHFMTGDTWKISISNDRVAPYDRQLRMLSPEVRGGVALLSGGLDSTAYAARATTSREPTPIMVTHQLAGTSPAITSAKDALRGLAGAGDERRDVVTTATVHDAEESSSRSRGFLFAATAVYVAAAYGVTDVVMPENGQLAINPPLTLARSGACSTRSVHPTALALLNEFVAMLGGNVRIRNPFLFLTKGEVCRVALESGLTAQQLADTISCGTAPQGRYGTKNCGRCYPCLIRRSGLEAALDGPDPTEYVHSLRPTSRHVWRDMRDLRRWLDRDFGRRDLIVDMPLPDDLDMDEILSTLHRGRQETMSMLRNHSLLT